MLDRRRVTLGSTVLGGFRRRPGWARSRWAEWLDLIEHTALEVEEPRLRRNSASSPPLDGRAMLRARTLRSADPIVHRGVRNAQGLRRLELSQLVLFQETAEKRGAARNHRGHLLSLASDCDDVNRITLAPASISVC